MRCKISGLWIIVTSTTADSHIWKKCFIFIAFPSAVFTLCKHTRPNLLDTQFDLIQKMKWCHAKNTSPAINFLVQGCDVILLLCMYNLWVFDIHYTHTQQVQEHNLVHSCQFGPSGWFTTCIANLSKLKAQVHVCREHKTHTCTY